MKEGAHQELRLGVFRPDLAHDVAPNFRREVVCHLHKVQSLNGIALNALHDKAFDRGLITFDSDLLLVCAPSLRDHFTNATVSQSFEAYEGKPLTLPAEAAGPKSEYLEYHRTAVFGK